MGWFTHASEDAGLFTRDVQRPGDESVFCIGKYPDSLFKTLMEPKTVIPPLRGGDGEGSNDRWHPTHFAWGFLGHSRTG